MSGQNWAARQEILISESRLARVTLIPQAPFVVNGTVTTEGGIAQLPQGLALQLQGLYTRGSLAYDLKEDGRFDFSLLRPDKYLVTVNDPSKSVYIKAIFLNDVQVTSRLLTIEQPPRSIRIVISEKAGKIEGTGLDSKKVQLSNATAVITKIESDGPQVYLAPIKNGAFSFESLAPGAYRLMCFTDLVAGNDASEETIKYVQSRGEEVTVKDGQKHTLILGCLRGQDSSLN